MSLRSEMQGVYDQHGELTPRLVLDAARKAPDSALHSHVFHVEGDEAAERYYLSRCSDLIRKIKVSYRKGESSPRQKVNQYYSLKGEDGYAYKAVEEIVDDPLTTKMLLRQMEHEWGALRKRYENFQEFWELVRKDSEAA